MNIASTIIANAKKPAPSWYRKFNAVFGNSETLTITILMASGHSDPAILLYIKLGSSFIRTNLGVILANGEEYAQAGSTQAIEDANISPMTVAAADTKAVAEADKK